MTVLWLVSVTMPEAAKAFGLPSGLGGGWLQGQLDAIRKKTSVCVVTVNHSVKQIQQAQVGSVEYILLPNGTFDEFAAVMGRIQPPLVHIWGSEYPAAKTLFALCSPSRTLVSVQGVMTECAAHLMDGVPAALLHSSKAQLLINSIVPGHLLDQMQLEFDQLAATEQAFLSDVRHVTGRTQWDQEQLTKLSPHADYFHCGEILREEFYSGSWQRRDFGDAPVLFLSQGNYPLKGLHRLLPAFAKVCRRYPHATLRIAGWPPLDKGPLLRPFIDRMFPYESWCKKLAKELNVSGNIEYTGPLEAEAMKQAYLKADCYCLCSSIENSPNSLGEAMLLGLPCVASRVGGVPSMATHGQDALLYPAADSDALAECILRVLEDGALAERLGQAAHRSAAAQYDPSNGETMYHIYEAILDGGTAP